MTDKQIFDELKAQSKERKRKFKMIKFLKASVNSKLNFTPNLLEDGKVELLQQLHEIELNEMRIRRNKFNSSAYTFKPAYRKNFGLK